MNIWHIFGLRYPHVLRQIYGTVHVFKINNKKVSLVAFVLEISYSKDPAVPWGLSSSKEFHYIANT